MRDLSVRQCQAIGLCGAKCFLEERDRLLGIIYDDVWSYCMKPFRNPSRAHVDELLLMSLHINYCLQRCAERILTDSGPRGEHRLFVLWFWIYFDEAVFCAELDAWSIRGLAV